jgi:hypothetical protein
MVTTAGCTTLPVESRSRMTTVVSSVSPLYCVTFPLIVTSSPIATESANAPSYTAMPPLASSRLPGMPNWFATVTMPVTVTVWFSSFGMPCVSFSRACAMGMGAA